MSFLNCFFNRHKIDQTEDRANEILYDSQESLDLLEEWCDIANITLENMPKFLKLTGISTPAKLSNFEFKNSKSFLTCTCATAENETFSLCFFVFVGNSYCSKPAQMRIIKEKESLDYELIEDGSELKANLITRMVENDLKILTTNTLLQENKKKYATVINFSYQYRLSLTIVSNFEFQNYNYVENYLLNLKDVTDIEKIYKCTAALINLSHENLASIDSFEITFYKNIEDEHIVLATMIFHTGQLVEHAVTIDGKTYHNYEHDKWEYRSDTVKVSCNNGLFSMTGTKENLCKINFQELLVDVKNNLPSLN